MTTTGSQFTVEPFNGKTSFTLWQRRVKDLLVNQGLAKALKGKPATMKDDDWEELQSKCVSTIRLCIADNIVNHVINEESATEIWEKMESLYLAKNLTNKLHLKRQLYRLKMVEGGNLLEHMNVFSGLLNQLRKLDVKIEEEDKALLLLTSLPDSYDALVTTLLCKDTISMELVQSSLVSRDTQKKIKEDEGQDSALVVRGENRGRSTDRGSNRDGRSRSNGGGKGVQCYHCQEWGHIRRLCPQRKKKDNDNGSGSIAMMDDGDDVLAVSDGNDTFSKNNWFLDSGCVRHVCSNKKYFDTFQEKMAGQLSMGNGSPANILGVGTVKIKMFDGAIRTLGGVAYAPTMRKNLISLSRLDSMGCKFSGADGVLKVTHGCMVLMKGEKCNGLYRLIGRTMVPKASMGVWKWRARVKNFQGVDDGEVVIPAGGEGDSRPFSEVN